MVHIPQPKILAGRLQCNDLVEQFTGCAEINTNQPAALQYDLTTIGSMLTQGEQNILDTAFKIADQLDGIVAGKH